MYLILTSVATVFPIPEPGDMEPTQSSRVFAVRTLHALLDLFHFGAARAVSLRPGPASSAGLQRARGPQLVHQVENSRHQERAKCRLLLWTAQAGKGEQTVS